jgi:hypothetical protein
MFEHAAAKLEPVAPQGEMVTENIHTQNVNPSWDFPVKPGTEGWKNFHSTQEMVDACQVPEDILSSLSTDELTDVCLQYPLLFSYCAFTDWNYAMEVEFHDFNGFRELFKRSEVAEELLKRYQAKISSINDTTILKEDYLFPVTNLDVLLSRCQSQEKEILQSLVTGYEKEIMYPDYFDFFSLKSNFFARAIIIAKMSPESLEKIPSGSNNSVFYGQGFNEETAIIIDELSYELINEKENEKPVFIDSMPFAFILRK